MERDTCYLVGHSHIDAAWLWTIEETIDVCHKTFKSILSLMRRYPLKFSQSSAQYYNWIEEKYPELFSEIRERVKEGRWEIVGGSWVEFDCNVPSGESIVRQFLYGKRYFSEKFSVDVKVCWLPDSFGFCWTLPQILTKSGMKYFVTQKLKWNDTTNFIYNVFWWRGPDGSRVLAHQTVGSYSEELRDETRILSQLNTCKLRHAINDLLVIFGVGDHGGGPTEEDLKTVLRWAKIEKLPKMKFSTVLEYFNRLEELAKSKTFPTVNDELYLQCHRGTYTTQANIKLMNRKAEVALENAEKLAAIAIRFGSDYPQQELESMWKRLLVNQFHDIICGSSIKDVYECSDKEYGEIFKTADDTTRNSIEAIASNVDTSGEAISILVFNTLSWPRDGFAETDLESIGEKANIKIKDPEGSTLPFQIIKKESKKLMFIGRNIPSLGFKEFKVVKSMDAESCETHLSLVEENNVITMENLYLKVSIDRSTGLINSVHDKVNNRELLSHGKGVAIQIYDDQPIEGRKFDGTFDAILFDAWEIYINDQPKGMARIRLSEPEQLRIIERGPIRSTIEVKYKYVQKGRPDSLLNVYATLYSDIPLLFLKIDVDWHAIHRLVKIIFPLNIESDYATYEIPYGFIERRNPLSPEASLTERAKWEVPGQRWIDYSSDHDDYGVSIINDCKYGFSQMNSMIGITLLRSPKYPPRHPATTMQFIQDKREATDQGKHEVNLAIYPHKGDWRKALTVRKAREFNNPLLAHTEKRHLGEWQKAHSFIEVQPKNIVLTVLKKAEDSENVVLRLFETNGEASVATITFDLKPSRIWEVDLMEREISELTTDERSVSIPMGACEIKTIKVHF